MSSKTLFYRLLFSIGALCILLLTTNAQHCLSDSKVHLQHSATTAHLLLFYSFIPRVIVALLSGALLGLAGWLSQILLRNPLAEPSTLGIASASQLGLTLASLLELSGTASAGVAMMAALISVLFIALLSLRSDTSPVSLLIAGLVVSLFCFALQNCLLLFNHERLQNIFIWSSGNLAQNDWSVVRALWPLAIIAVVILHLMVRPLNLLLLPDAMINSMGASSSLIRIFGLLLVAMIAGWSVIQVGILGFIGLLAPQYCRLLTTLNFSVRLALLMLSAALITLLFDQMALLASYYHWQLTAGHLSSVCGIILMLFIIQRIRIISPPNPGYRASGGNPRQAWILYLLILLAGLAAICLSLLLPLPGHWQLSTTDPLNLRWPRLLLTLSCGALLAMCGVFLQKMTANPLASPEVLGINSGAACGIVIMLLLFPLASSMMQLVAAMTGAVISLTVICMVSFFAGNEPNRILLAGSALSALSGAVISILLVSGIPEASQIISWLSGSAWQATPTRAETGLLVLLISLPVSLLLQRWLLILNLGPMIAQSLGLSRKCSQSCLLLWCAILSAFATLLLGPMSFVGLLAPQIVSKFGITRPAALLLSTALLGGVLMLLADSLGRIIVWPFQIPAGIMAVLMGTPLFLWLLLRKKF